MQQCKQYQNIGTTVQDFARRCVQKKLSQQELLAKQIRVQVSLFGSKVFLQCLDIFIMQLAVVD